MEKIRSTEKDADTAKLSESSKLKQKLSFAFYAVQAFVLVASGISICGFKEQAEPFAATAMLFCSLYICAFAREKSTVGYLIIPAYLIVLFTGNTSIPSLVVGICTFIGVGAFLKRVRFIAFIISAALTACAVTLTGGINAALIFIVLIPATLLLSGIYPRCSLPRAVGAVSLVLGITSVICLTAMLYTNLLPGIAVKENIISEVKELVITMIAEKFKETGNHIGIGAIQQMVDGIFINLPGIFAMIVEIPTFLSIAVCGALFRNFGLEAQDFTMAKNGYLVSPITRYLVSPITGIVFFVSAAIGPYSFAESTDIASAVANNVFLAVLIPLAVFAVWVTARALKKKGMMLAGKTAEVLMILLALLSGINGIAVLSAIGAIISIAIPLRYYITKKLDNKK